jgi:predicted methyltransferase
MLKKEEHSNLEQEVFAKLNLLLTEKKNRIEQLELTNQKQQESIRNANKKIQKANKIIKELKNGKKQQKEVLKEQENDGNMFLTIKTTDGIEFYYRENTSDIKAIEEACGKIAKGPTKSAYTRTHKEPKFIIENNDIWLDIGAHIGAFSLRAIKDGASHVYSIEPHPENEKMLMQNMQLNSFSAGKHIIIKMQSLHNLLSSYPSINAIKIDAEGSEVDILKYSDLFCSNVAKIVFEYSFDHFPIMKDFF